MKKFSYGVIAALVVAFTLWAGLVPAQNVQFARVPRPAGSSSRRPVENYATELRECVARAYAAAPVALGTPLQQPLSAGEFGRRFDATPRCGRVGRREALEAAVASGLVGGTGGGSGGGSIARVPPPPPPIGAPPAIPAPPTGPVVATAQQVQAAVADGRRVLIVERPAGAGPAVVAPAPELDPGGGVVPPPRPQRCTTCADAGADAADASDG